MLYNIITLEPIMDLNHILYEYINISPLHKLFVYC
jgi:hypothetical protein